MTWVLFRVYEVCVSLGLGNRITETKGTHVKHPPTKPSGVGPAQFNLVVLSATLACFWDSDGPERGRQEHSGSMGQYFLVSTLVRSKRPPQIIFTCEY